MGALACLCAGLRASLICFSRAVPCRSQTGARGTVAASPLAAGAQKRQCRPRCGHIAPPLRQRGRQRAGAAGGVPHLATWALQDSAAGRVTAREGRQTSCFCVTWRLWASSSSGVRERGRWRTRTHCLSMTAAPPTQGPGAAGARQHILLPPVLPGAAHAGTRPATNA